MGETGAKPISASLCRGLRNLWRWRSEPHCQAVGLATAIGIVYFLAAMLGFALRAHAGLAVFAPAAGIAVAALIALGRKARLTVAVAVAIASFASSITIGTSPWTAVPVSCVNVGQALLTAWMIERWFGGVFKLDVVRQVLGFLGASAAGAAMGATGMALATAFAGPDACFQEWRLSFASRLLGTVAVAPLLIGLVEALRERPPHRELVEGAAGLVTLAALSVFLVCLPREPWESALPVAFVLPCLLWVTVRCRPVFAAAAVSLLAVTVVWSLTSSLGHFGDVSIPIANRVLAGQTYLLAIALLSLVLAALFAERRSREALLRRSNAQLSAQKETFRRLLGSLPAAIYTTDTAGRITYCNQAAVDLWGRSPELGIDKWSDLWRLHHADGTSVPLDERPTQIVLNEGRAVKGREALLERPDGTLVPIMPCPAPLLDEQGAVVGVVNMQLDLTERKRAEAALAERDTLLTLANKAARVGSYFLDYHAGIVRLTPGCAALYGLPEGTTELSHAEGRACVHPEDLAGLDAHMSQAFAEQRREHVAQFRVVRPSDGEVRWIESRCLISYEGSLPSRIVGIDIDLTDRKQVEAEIKESESRLADALAAGQVIAFEWDACTRRSRRSSNAAAILGFKEGHDAHGFPEVFLERVHPDDRESFKAHIRNLRVEMPSYALSFRVRGPDGRQLWLEETAKGEFDALGRLLRIKGLTRNITDRKEAERALADRNLQLSLAARAALVGSFSYDIDTEEIQVSDGYAAIHGLPEDDGLTTRDIWLAGLLPEDRAHMDELRSRVFREQRSEYGTEYRIVRDGAVRWIEARCFISYHRDGRPERMVGVNIDVTERKRAEEHQRLLIAELDHRVKNVLATVSAVASRTQDESLSGAEFATRLAGRIQSMAATHELLSGRQWKGVSVRELVRRELAPYMAKSNTDFSGPDVTLSPEAGQTLSMVLHELTTNAAKYGALSTDAGSISVRWHREWNVGAGLCIEWHEVGGPAVEPPTKTSFGTEVIRSLIPYELGGTVDLAFAAEGIRCVISIPTAELSQGIPGGSLRLVDLGEQERELGPHVTIKGSEAKNNTASGHPTFRP